MRSFPCCLSSWRIRHNDQAVEPGFNPHPYIELLRMMGRRDGAGNGDGDTWTTQSSSMPPGECPRRVFGHVWNGTGTGTISAGSSRRHHTVCPPVTQTLAVRHCIAPLTRSGWPLPFGPPCTSSSVLAATTFPNQSQEQHGLPEHSSGRSGSEPLFGIV